MAKRKTGTDEPTREEQRQFAADKFKWLRQIALDLELPPLASRFAILLLSLFNLEYDGVAWAGQDTLAAELGCHRVTVNQLFRLLAKRGHLTYQRGGWGRSNRYQMAFKEEVSDVTKPSHQEASDVAVLLHQEQATDVAVSLHSDVAVSLHESLLTNYGDPKGSPGVREAAGAAAAGGPGLDGHPVGKKKKASKQARPAAPGSKINGAAVPHPQDLQTLQATWDRKWDTDTSARAHEEVKRAWIAAVADATPETILAAARKYVAAHLAAGDDERYLTKLPNWLNARSKDGDWNKPPPSKGRAKPRRHGRRSNGVSAHDEVFESAAELYRRGQ